MGLEDLRAKQNRQTSYMPTANSQQPTANSQQPTANSQQPTANSQQPTANSQQPTANSKKKLSKKVIIGIVIGGIFWTSVAYMVGYNAAMNDLRSKFLNGLSNNQASDIADSSSQQQQAVESTQKEQSKPVVDSNKQQVYEMGQTWTVDGEWAVTVTGVREANEADFNMFIPPDEGKHVYVVNYSYTNLGYEPSNYSLYEGLRLDLCSSFSGQVIDSAGVAGDSYIWHSDNSPKEIPVGATCQAETAVQLNNPGEFMIYVSEYDSQRHKQKAVFHCVP